MANRIFPTIPETADELLRRIPTGDGTLDAESFEQQLAEMLYSHLNWTFDYASRYYPECVGVSPVLGGRILDVVDLGNNTPKGYNPKTTPHYRLGEYIIDGYEVNRSKRFIVSHVEPVPSGSSTTDLFNRLFDSSTGQLLGPNDGVVTCEIYELVSRPELYFKKHLDESWLAKKKRVLGQQFLGKLAVDYGKLPNGN